MIRFLRRYSVDALRRCFLEKGKNSRSSGRRSSRGQVALVLILLAAVGLVLYAVILRYGPVSQTKTRTMVGAQKAASAMASFMASYANRLSHEYLKGRLSYCKSTSLLGRILLFVVLLVFTIVIAYVCPPAGPVGYGAMAALWAAVVFAGFAVALDAIVLQPGITRAWNKMMAKMSTEDYLIETGIQNAFLTAVNDNQPFPDFLDFAGEGVSAKMGDWEANTTSRFSFYYTQRLRQVENPINLALEEFAKQLRRFVLVQDNPLWGLHDHLGFNPCDISFDFPLGGHNLMDECSVYNKPVEEEGECVGSHCFYDPFFEYVGNSYFSFRENMGRDAERPYGVYSIGPSGAFYDYRVEDMSGYYRADPRKRHDGRPAIYLPLYMMEDIGVNLTELRSLAEDYRYNCYWLHEGCETPYDPQHPDTGIRNPTIPALEPLFLPHLDPAILANSGGLSGRDMGFSAGSNDDFLAAAPERLTHVDLVRPPELFFLDNRIACGHDASGAHTGRWKRGIDRFCSSEYPYHMECAKHSGCTEPDPEGGPAMDIDCFCPNASGLEKRFFPEDFLDDIFYGVWDFVKWAQIFLFIHSKDDGSFLARDFKVWYDQDAADWFEPDCAGSCPPGSMACCPGSFTKRNRKGGLIALEENIRHFTDTLFVWLWDEEGNTTFVGEKPWGGLAENGYAAWCVPPHPSETHYGPVEISQSELATFDSGGFYGDIASVLSCMDWNLLDMTEFLNKEQAIIQSIGNHEKFAACRDHCSIRACSRIEHYPDPWTTEHYGMTDPSLFDPFLPRTSVTFPGSGGSYPGLASYYFEAGHREWFIECSFAADATFPPEYRKPPHNLSGTVWDYCLEMCQEAPIDEYQSEFGGAPPAGVEAFNANFFCQYHLDFPDVCYQKPSSIAMNCYDATSTSACLNWCPRLNDCNYNFRLTLSDWEGPRAAYYPEFCHDRFAEPVEGSVECGLLDDCGTCDHLGEEATPEELQACLDALTPCQDAWHVCMSDHEAAEAAKAEAVAHFMALLEVEAEDDRFLRDQTQRFFEGVEVLKHTADSPSCDPASPYYESILIATYAAGNHMAKIAHRQTFLMTMRSEILPVAELFAEASDRFSEFLNNRTPFIRGPAGSELILGGEHLVPERARVVRWWEDGGYSADGGTVNVYAEHGVDSPVELLISERYRQELPKDPKDNTSSVAVYVWRGPDIKPSSAQQINGAPTQMGPIHAVKVEMRAPKRCNARCNLSGTGEDGWPWIRTKTKRWGTKRCYYLMDYQGMTKARVIRYDEPKAESRPLFRFGNNVLIRGLWTAHPDTAASNNSAAVQNVFSVCAAQIHPHISGVGRRYASISPDNPQYLEHAFMLNYVPDPGQDDRVDGRYMSCWNYVHTHLLEKGTHAESCAQYYWQDGMNIRFAPCDAGFSSGQF